MNFNFWELLERGIRFDAKNRIIYRVIILHYVVKNFYLWITIMMYKYLNVINIFISLCRMFV